MSKVILTHEVSGLGGAGDVVDVKPGFARNYLIPQGFAVAWSRGGEKDVAALKAAREARALATVDEANELKARLESAVVTVSAKTGQGGRLFGAIKAADVAAAVAAAGLGDVDKRKIEVSNAIKSVGDYEATVRVFDDIVANLKLKVVSA